MSVDQHQALQERRVEAPACGGLCRRHVLLGAGAVSAAALLTACGSSTSGGGPIYGEAGSSSAGGTSAGLSRAPSSSSQSSSTSSSSSTSKKSSASSSPSGGALTKVSDIPVGSAVSAKDPNGKPIVIAQPTKNKVVAFSAICTHMGCTVMPSGDKYVCPCHGSMYQAATGKNISGPAPRPLASFAVKVVKGQVYPG